MNFQIIDNLYMDEAGKYMDKEFQSGIQYHSCISYKLKEKCNLINTNFLSDTFIQKLQILFTLYGI